MHIHLRDLETHKDYVKQKEANECILNKRKHVHYETHIQNSQFTHVGHAMAELQTDDPGTASCLTYLYSG